MRPVPPMSDTNKKRPQLLDKSVLESIAGRLLPDLVAWFDSIDEVLSEKDEMKVFNSVVKLLHQQNGRWDGYVLARTLEEHGWFPTAELVEILHDSNRVAQHCLREEAIRWVHDNGLVPQFKVGELVQFVAFANEPPMKGKISEVHQETLEFSVTLPSGTTILLPQESIFHSTDP